MSVNDQVTVTFTGYALNRYTNTFDTLATLSNKSSQAIQIPIQLVISNISQATVKLANASGALADGTPYVSVPLGDGALSPGETVKNIPLKFSNPQRVGFTFSKSVMGVLPTANHPPVANAGGDITVTVGTEVTLSAIASSDEDGNTLTYRWRILEKPANSVASLNDAGAVQPRLTIDRKGNYLIELIVNDGQIDSAAAVVVITTENSKPVARAGADQTVKVQQTAYLDGLNSSDIDQDTLTFNWLLLGKPVDSSALLKNQNIQTPNIIPDKPGSYTLQLTVNDGLLDSLPDQLIVSTENSKPIADAGGNQTTIAGTSVILDGSLSSDIDNDPLSYAWSVLSKPVSSNPELKQADQVKATLTPDLPGDYVAQLIVNDSKLNSDPASSLVTVSAKPVTNHPLQITSMPVTTATIGKPYVYDVDATDSDNDALSYSLSAYPTGMSINSQTGIIGWTPAAGQTGTQAVTVKVTDGKGGSDSQSYSITVVAADQTTMPNVVDQSRAAAEQTITLAKLNVGTLTFQHNAKADGSVISQSLAAGSSVKIGTVVNLTVSLGPDKGLPPNPVTAAPKLDPTVATTTYAASQFLYSGSNPIQTGVQPGTIDAKRAAVIRGKVLDKDNNPLSGVTIAIKDHPELGQTLSRADGQYDMAANGGGLLTLNYQKSGYLPAQRQVTAPWQNYVIADTAILVQQDAKLSTVNLNDNTHDFQVAQGSQITDKDGIRQATLLIPIGTQAQIYNADGTTKPVTTLNLRLTEYTVGANGPAAMPGPLPPSSAYTYAFEMKAEETDVKVDGKDVLFDRAVPFYIDNFLSFPVGTIVPVGYYDRAKATWIPSDNGKVIKIFAVNNGIAEIDSDNDNLADDAAKLSALGITIEERTQLASLYQAGKTLWRVQVTHLSTWDCNWPYKMPDDAVQPKNPQPFTDKKEDDPCKAAGSIIECENQVLGETLPVTGTQHTLNYRSSRVSGRKNNANTIRIPVSGATLPSSLKRIDLIVDVAGQHFEQSLPPTTNQTVSFTWNGLDAFGRPVQGGQSAVIKIGYAYAPVYATPAELSAAFGRFSGVPLEGSRARQEVRIWQEQTIKLGAWTDRSANLGAWSLDEHHAYDPIGRVLYMGDGSQRSVLGAIATSVMTTVAGNGEEAFNGDGGPAISASLRNPYDVAVDVEGYLYISDLASSRIRRVSPAGIITTIAGNGTSGVSGDGGPATQAAIGNVRGIALGPDGSLYFCDTYTGYRVRRVGPDGIITTVAGNGQRASTGDGGPATQAALAAPQGIAVGNDGSVYISETAGDRIRRVSPNGIITTVAGNGTSDYSGDGGPATKASLDYPSDIALGTDGSLYIMDAGNYRIRKVGLDGIITTVAGDGITELSSENIELDSKNNVYFTDQSVGKLRKVNQIGVITDVAGNGEWGFNGDGGPATQTALSYPMGIAFGPDGDIYISDLYNQRIRRVSPALPGFNTGEIAIPSEDGTELYSFDSSGRHLATLNTLTGATLLSFGYDTQGHLSQITDGDGLITRIGRDAQGNPTAIVAPFGQRTTLSLDANGYLAKVTNPAGETHEMVYTTDGLLTSFKDPSGNASTFSYDAQGRLFTDANAIGGISTLVRSELADGYAVSLTTALNRVTSHAVRNLSTGDRERKHTQPDYTVSTTQEKTDGTVATTDADGTLTTLLKGPDPRFSILSPIAQSRQTSTGGLTANLTTKRTATLADSNNPLSLTTLTDTVTLNGRTRTTVFDAATKTFTSTSPAARQTKTVIDSLGRLTQTQATGLLPIINGYDPQGRPATIIQGAGADERLISFAYNPQGYLDSITDPIGRQVKYQYDLAGRVAKKILPDNREILFGYDANGNLTSLTPPSRPDHSFTYTPVDQTASSVPPDVATGSNSTLYHYNLDKQLIQIQRPDGQTVDYTYDTAGRAGKVTVPEGDYIYGYHASTGKLIGIDTPDGLGLDYSLNGALPTQTSWSGAVSGSVGKSYDNDFRVASISVNGANAIAYGYDADNLLNKAGDLTLSRDAQNGLLTGTVLGSLTDSYSYNGFGEVSAYLAKYGTSNLYKTDFSRDKLGRITQKIETLGSVTNNYDYGYDVAGRLSEVKFNGTVQASYGYDANGNRTQVNGQTVAHYDDQDRLLDFGTASYAYTANGELKTKTIGAATIAYSYDVLGNLRHVALSGGTAIDYLVDGQNRRIGKKRNNVLEQGFLYQDQLKPVAELDGNGNVISRFVYATAANVPDYMIKGGNTYRIVKDHLGSPRLIVDIATNTVLQKISYDVWGKVTQDTNPGFQPFGYAGGLYDRDTGLVRFGARDYDPQTGRWTAKDPIGFEGGDTNLYEYVVNDPVNDFDPDGLMPIEGVGTTSRGPTGNPISGGNVIRTPGEQRVNKILSKVVEKITGKIAKIDPATGKIVSNARAFGIGLVLYSEGLAECQSPFCDLNGDSLADNAFKQGMCSFGSN
ncbi:NHL domain-containing protein [Methylomonas rosea]|uniref:PKD domain-containing protein n=1 Tax=Methylomonas rosea TaxID=2952227 RepID=A0ABT1TXI8_9GAMM|nr:PKD domain-containing protein [Methylomonas sp. WSC-7]